MRNILGLVLGLYFTVALVVFATAAWSFNTEARWKAGGACANPDWLGWASIRAIAWPKAWMETSEIVGSDVGAWLTVQYNPFPEKCG